MKNFFRFKELKTDYKTEINAGVTTFMTMAYIVFVNPYILSSTGMDFGAVMTATIISAGLTTILMGILTNYPFALASGMGLNAFFAYVIAPQYGWQTALGAVFFSGIIFAILALSGNIRKIDIAVPVGLKSAVAVAIGFFIAFIGLQSSNIIVISETTYVSLGNLGDKGPLITIFGVFITAILIVRKIKGAILFGIFIATLFSIIIGFQDLPGSISDIFGPPASLSPVLFKLDLYAVLRIPFFVVFSLVFVDLFNTMGTLLGTGASSGYLDDKGCLPKVNRAMFVDAVGTVCGSLLGTSTVTTYVESTTGISEGGKSGFTSVVTGTLFFLTLFIAPLAGLIPPEATAPALIIVGVFMVGSVAKIDFTDFTEAFPAFLVILTMPLAYSITDSIATGFIAYPVTKVAAGRSKEVKPLMYFLLVASLIHFAIPF